MTKPTVRQLIERTARSGNPEHMWRAALNERMQRMTFGQLPTQSQFDKAFDETIGDDIGFSFDNDPRIGTDTLNATQLWKAVNKAMKEYEDGTEEAGDWVSDVLWVLGFEWI